MADHPTWEETSDLVTSEPVQNDYQDLLNRAISGDPEAKMAVIDRSLAASTEGSTKAPESSLRVKPVYTVEQASEAGNNPDDDASQPQKYADGGDVLGQAMTPSWDSTDALTEQPPIAATDPTQAQREPALQGPVPTWEGTEDAEAKYGTAGQMLKAGAEGLAKGLFGPAATLAETKLLGVKPEDIRGREEVNPVTHYGTEITGLVAPALVTGGTSAAAVEGATTLQKLAPFTQAGAIDAISGKLFGKAAVKSAEAAEKLAEVAGPTLAARIGQGAAKAAVDNMLLAGSDETSKMILNDPNQSAESAIASIGLSGVIGGALGATGSGVMALWNKESGGKTGSLISDFRSRIQEHVNNPDPVSSMTEELGNYYKAITGAADEVYGPTGIKAQDIQKLMPELNPKIGAQSQETFDLVSKALDKMEGKPHAYPDRLVSKLRTDLEAYSQAISNPEATSGDIFNASQELKQSLQGYAKFDKFVTPVDEAYDFIRDAKGLAHDVRLSLENPTVWGDAAKRQQVINKAFSEYLPTLKDFEKKFTTTVAGEKTIDPGKIQTYINQLGNAKAEIKQTMLANFLDKSEKYQKVITDSHLNLGLDRPFEDVSLNVTRNSLNEKTLGAKLADAFIDKGLTDTGAHALGAGLGATLGHATGLGGAVGSLIGAAALGPFFKSILPALAKSLIGSPTSAVGFKAATDFASQITRGQLLMNRAAKNVFRMGAESYATASVSDKQREKLDKYIAQANKNPEKLLDGDSHLQHYLPDTAMSKNQSVGRTIAYLNSLRPDTTPQMPLDSKIVPSAVAKAKYNQALNIAEHPLSVLDKVKQGTVTADDVKHMVSMYPELYKNMQAKLADEMVAHLAKGESIPYKTRVALSVFMGQPLDSTMTQGALMATQGLIPAVPSPMGPPPGQKGKGSSGVKSSPALQKMPALYQTPAQARALNRTKY